MLSSTNTLFPSSSSSTSDATATSRAAASVEALNKDTPSFEDNPGNLPEDAIKPDDSQSVKDTVSEAEQEKEKTRDVEEKLRDQLKEDAATGLASEEQKVVTSNGDASSGSSENNVVRQEVCFFLVGCIAYMNFIRTNHLYLCAIST